MTNYFEIFSAADKEMVHSAMLKELLEEPFFRERLFKDAQLPEKVKLIREKKLPPYDDRFDLLIFDPARNDKLLLVLENKFKSLPTAAQLQKYDKILKDKKYRGAVKYLLVFNSSVLGDCLASVSGWNVLAYREIVQAIRDYITENPDQENKKLILLQEYADYLAGYISRYDQMIANPAILNEWKKDKNDEHEMDSKDYKFFRRLFLGNLAIRLNKKFPDFVISNVSGGAQEPLLDIYPPDWNKNPEGKWPRIFIQFQGDKIKFYLRWKKAGAKSRKKMTDSEKQAILNYLKSLKGLEGIDLEHVENRLDGSSVSCSICAAPFTPKNNMDACVAQVADFYRQIDKAVQESGKF